jgi:Rrf2 family protein
MDRRESGILVERAHADAADPTLGIPAEELSAAVRAEALLESLVRRVPASDELLALEEANRAGLDPNLGRGRGAAASLTARAMAVGHRDRRLGDLEAHTAAQASAGQHRPEHNQSVRITAKADYAVRATVQLAAAGEMITAEQIADAQGIPLNFLENILRDLRRAGLVESRRGQAGGYALARAADAITLADVIRAVEGPLANVRGMSPERLDYAGSAEKLRDVWVALRAGVRSVLEGVTVADVARGELPEHIEELTGDEDAWARR